MISAIKKKIKSSKAFSMGEMLVATLILGLMTTALAAGISTAQRVYYDNVTYSEKRMLLSTAADAIKSELRYAKEPTFLGESGGASTFTNPNYTIKNSEGKDTSPSLIKLNTYTSTNFGFNCRIHSDQDQPLKLYKYTKDGTQFKYNQASDLIGSGVYSNDKLKVKLLENEVGYDQTKNVYVVTLQVYETGKDPADGETRTIVVKPLELPTTEELTNYTTVDKR